MIQNFKTYISSENYFCIKSESLWISFEWKTDININFLKTSYNREIMTNSRKYKIYNLNDRDSQKAFIPCGSFNFSNICFKILILVICFELKTK
jgi:viroplasmin and RNaseH domain-containing protein